MKELACKRRFTAKDFMKAVAVAPHDIYPTLSAFKNLTLLALLALTAIIAPARATDPNATGTIPPPSQQGGAAAHFYTSLHGAHVAGYQGWFACPGDGGGVGWLHWGNADSHDLDSLGAGLWPDTSELGPDELCPTSFKLPSGATAYLYSAENPKTVARHFKWMAQYGIDGVAMQRFTAAVVRPAIKKHLETVLRNARAGAEANHRGIFIMYDISGARGDDALSIIKSDWPHLTGDLHITDSPAYIYDRGRPVVAVWGIGVNKRLVNPTQAAAIIQYFRTAGATVMGGVPDTWRNDPSTDAGWRAVYASLDIVSPWTVGSYKDDQSADEFARARLGPDIAEARRLGVEYMPVVLPGTGWPPALTAARPPKLRRCGEFYKRQISNALNFGADMLYTAMFDEVNEGTAIFKVAVTKSQEPAGANMVTLDANGCTAATSDMYLRIAGEATSMLRKVGGSK